MFYNILHDSRTSGTLTVSKKTEIFNLFNNRAMVHIGAGYENKKVNIQFSKEQEENIIKISSDILSEISIPTELSYQINISKNNIKIGPVIGLLMFKLKESVTLKSLKYLVNYTLLYENFKGLIYVFSLEDINFENHKVSGYSYCPSEKTWKKGVFPFPDAIFRRVSIPLHMIKKLQKDTCGRIFNSVYFNKLDYWNMVRSNKPLIEHIPVTKKLMSFNDIENMLENFNAVYLKPINSKRAIGLIKVSKDNGMYQIQSKTDNEPVIFSTKNDAEKHVNNIKMNRIYIVQEAVDLLNFENRFVDFRVVMQKDNTLQWQCSGIVTSIGKQGGVCSNYNVDDKYMSFEDFLNKYLNLKNQEIFMKKQEIIELSKKACKVLDENGRNYGDLGVDIGLDKNLKPWVFELNNRYHLHTMMLFIGDYDGYYKVKTNPIKYAIKLTGFDV